MEKRLRPAILLMGPPNVGKSVLFNRLTGMNVSCANYSGTTVEVAAGNISLNGSEAILFDVPGTYTLNATNEAEQVAVEMLKGSSGLPCAQSTHCGGQTLAIEDMASDNTPAAVLCVLDASNLESSLFLLLQVMQYNLPVLAILNRTDLASEKGETIDTAYLSRELGLPLLPTVAITGEGFGNIKTAILDVLDSGVKESYNQLARPAIEPHEDDLWARAEELARKATAKDHTGGQKAQRRHKWGLLLLQPWPGIPLAAVILATAFGVVVGLGMGLRQFILLPLFRDLIIPAISHGVGIITSPGLFQNILIGEYGFLVKGLEWPFALVLPYVISFYFALSLLEDSGYMPRLGGLLDGLLNKVGLRGSGIIPLILGYGCGIPAIMATRALDSNKERLVVSTMVCLAIPCVSQSGAIISLLAEISIAVVIALFLLSFAVLAAAGLLMEVIIKGPRQHTLMEVPELLPPRFDVVGKKVWMRIKNYVTDGVLPMIGAVALAALLYESGAMAALGRLLSPLVIQWLRLPQDAAVPLVLGILRRELAVLPLMEMDLTALQLFVGAAVGLFYVPCIAIVATMAREFSLKVALAMLLLTSSIAFLAGGIISRAGALLF